MSDENNRERERERERKREREFSFCDFFCSKKKVVERRTSKRFCLFEIIPLLFFAHGRGALSFSHFVALAVASHVAPHPDCGKVHLNAEHHARAQI